MTLRQWLYRNVYLHTPYWKKIRQTIGRRAKWKCEARGCTEHGTHLDVHHTTYRVWFFSILWLEWLFPKRMVYLCRKHHEATHNGFHLYLKNKRELRPFGWK